MNCNRIMFCVYVYYCDQGGDMSRAILCGDFNSGPVASILPNVRLPRKRDVSAVFELMTTGKLLETHSGETSSRPIGNGFRPQKLFFNHHIIYCLLLCGNQSLKQNIRMLLAFSAVDA
jgi:hypothetical protein